MDIKKLLIYILIGFYIGFIISAVLDPSDICGGNKSIKIWGPLGFILIATTLLILFFFISESIKKDRYFITLIIVFGILFEKFIAQPYIKQNNLSTFADYIIMPLIHLAIFYIPRILVKKILNKK